MSHSPRNIGSCRRPGIARLATRDARHQSGPLHSQTGFHPCEGTARPVVGQSLESQMFSLPPHLGGRLRMSRKKRRLPQCITAFTRQVPENTRFAHRTAQIRLHVLDGITATWRTRREQWLRYLWMLHPEVITIRFLYRPPVRFAEFSNAFFVCFRHEQENVSYKTRNGYHK